jgi:serine/threonine protein phosphatase PrpC
MQIASATDIGRIRLLNEDSHFIQKLTDEYCVAVVADGMGGHRAGDMASQLAIETIAPYLSNMPSGLSIEGCKSIVRKAIEHANQNVYDLAAANPDLQGMGTTVALAVATDKWFVTAHVGDSRVYLWEKHVARLHQLTSDHSVVGELIKKGQITVGEAASHPHRNVLTRAVGTDLIVEIEFGNWMWNDGDQLMLCSDGLSNMVPESAMSEILGLNCTLEEGAKAFIQSALKHGGEDNITVAIIRNSAGQGGE